MASCFDVLRQVKGFVFNVRLGPLNWPTACNSPHEMEPSAKSLDRWEWWGWSASTFVIWLLSVTVVYLSQAPSADLWEPLRQLGFSQAVRSLFPAVLVFTIYSFYQRTIIRELRKRLVVQTSVAQASQARAEDLYERAIRDSLTGLFNRRYVEEHLHNELSRAKRSGIALSVVILDLNRFKEVNDQYGHAAGDAMLQAFALQLKKIVRAEDIPSRLGGDEFLVVLPGCANEDVPAFLSKLSHPEVQIQNSNIQCGYEAGWATADSGATTQALLAKADEHLYSRKKGFALPFSSLVPVSKGSVPW